MSTGHFIHAFYGRGGGEALPMIAHAEGPYLFDRDGRRYIDAASGPVVTNIGHGNPHVVEAIAHQAETVCFASRTAFASDVNGRFAETVARLSGSGFDRVFPTSGGSEAIEAALKFARQVAWARSERTRWKVISRQPSYHGSTLGALSVTGDEEAEAVFGPMMAPMPKVPAPFTYRIPKGYDAAGWQAAAARALEDTIQREGPETCLAFIVEPVGGLATGALVADDAYYDAIRSICSRYGLLLIYDEVMSGAGRTGRFLSADHWPDARPDIAVLAKGLGAGYTPLGTMIAPAELVDSVAENGGFLHGHTYVANPLSCATGLAVLEEAERLDVVGNAARLGPELRKLLLGFADRSPIVGDVRGKGLLMAIEFVADKKSKQALPLSADITARVSRHAMANGLIVYARRTSRGRFGEWVMICPPLTIDSGGLEEIGSALEKTLFDVSDELVRDGILVR